MKKILYILLLFLTTTLYSQIRVSCVGNSITEGFGLDIPYYDAYPPQLGVLLGAGYDVNNYGVTGRTMLRQSGISYWDENQYTQAKDFNPNIVIIKLGTNDANISFWSTLSDEYEPDYKLMIAAFKALAANPKIYICRVIPMFSKTIGVKDTTITNQVNPIIKEVALDEGVNLIDLYPALNNISYYQIDSIHPNLAGAGRIAFIVDSVFSLTTPTISKSALNVLSTQSANAYQWYKGTTRLVGETNSTYTATEDGYYKVSLKLSATSETRLVSDSLLVNLSEIPVDSTHVSFYPNLVDKSIKMIAPSNITSIHIQGGDLNKTASCNNDTVTFRVKYIRGTGYIIQTQ
jgi:lysophospholipase L1-like esterase